MSVMSAKSSDWRPGPSVCRCCFAEGCYKDISTEYFWMGKREVYQEMLSDTFDVSISYSLSGGPNSNSRLICEPCISRLRDASDFKRQVQECERVFQQHLDPSSSGADLEALTDAKEVKLERVKLESKMSDDDDDFDGGGGFDDDDDDDLDDQPLTKLATKVPKKESIDLMDLLDNAKPEKRKAVAKPKASPAKKIKLTKKTDAPKPSVSKPAPKPAAKKKGPQMETERRQGALSSVWEMTLSERKNAAYILQHTTARPFIYCRYFYKCFFCGEQFQDLNILLQHTLNHDVPDHEGILKALLPKGKRTVKVDISTLICKICKEKFTNLEDIKQHLSANHSVPFTDSGTGIVAYNLSLKDGQYECHLCNKIIQTFVLLNRHMNVHFRNAVCETCGAGFMTHQRLLQHKEIHLPGGYPCKACDKVYTTSSNLKYHVEKVHEGSTKSRSLRCPHCSERFSEHFRKLKHLKEAHGITFTFQCEECKSTFPSRRALTIHTNKFHSQKTQCELCRKSFSCITTLKKHMVCHTGERNYICSICQKSYRHQKSLKRHINTHANGIPECIICSDCEHRFPNRNEFNRHVKEWHPRSYCNFALN